KICPSCYFIERRYENHLFVPSSEHLANRAAEIIVVIVIDQDRLGDISSIENVIRCQHMDIIINFDRSENGRTDTVPPPNCAGSNDDMAKTEPNRRLCVKFTLSVENDAR